MTMVQQPDNGKRGCCNAANRMTIDFSESFLRMRQLVTYNIQYAGYQKRRRETQSLK